MVSLSYRSLANFIVEDNLIGLRGFLDNRHVAVDDRDENGATALILAAAKGKAVFVKELLSHGADPNLADNDSWTALHCAAKEGYTPICIELINHGAATEHREMGGWSPLMWACYKGHTETVRLLVEQRADVNVNGQYHITPLMWASGRGHTDIVRILLDHGAKVNTGDKYGTTALIWACRKGHTEIVDMLLKAGANVEVSGMYCWTPLLVSTKENFVEIVLKLLEKKPNVNAVDKDGCTALTVSCKEGYYEICVSLLNNSAYVNLQDRSGDTNLIHAAKCGHKSIVEALLKKYADVNMTGKERKTALYWAVEKNHASVVRALLNADPNLEIATKEGDTPLLRAVRNRNLEIVQMLLDKKAKVVAADKEGDTALHIAMRARSKAIVEVLLRNPKNSQLLYRPNRNGETPYNIDISQQKTILGQIFGARRLNTNEDNENMLGYDLYSSALADMLSEPSLSMPITVGLYAKWGSGKSFLLNKLREEMKGFARQWLEPQFQHSLILVALLLHISTLLGIIIGVSCKEWIPGVAVGTGSFILINTFLYTVYWGTRRYSWNWAYNVSLLFARRLDAFKLILQVTFCTPPGAQWGGDNLRIQPIRFYFTDQTKVSRTASGENSVVQMIGSLLDSIESDYGVLATRLYRAFRPKPQKSASPWRFRRFCCVPYFVIFIASVDILLAGLVILIMYETGSIDSKILSTESTMAVLITIGIALGVVMIANLYTWSRVIQSLVMSQRRKLQRNVARIHSVKAEGYLQALKREVDIMVEMVRCLDAFSGQQTRLVMVVDGLDSCEQDQVLYVLDAVHLLFTERTTPFITLLAIDPHIIIKAIELNLHRMFNESNIGGHDYLRNLVHLPFFLQNAGLRKVKTAQQAAITARNPKGVNVNANNAAVLNWLESDEANNATQPLSHRRLSMESSSAPPKPLGRGSKVGSMYPPNFGPRKLRPSESMESGLGMSGPNRVLAAQDLTKVLLTDDYFSDVNPRSMRRLMNVIYITGRLLKAFQIEFNWYHLASWVNITEQWPYRSSWIILYCEVNEDKIDDFTTLKTVYDRVKPYIPTAKDVEPFLEMDRDEKKLEIFLSFHRNPLQILHLKIFIPFTIHLDPYLRKIIKEERPSFLAMESGIVQHHVDKGNNPPGGNPPTSQTAAPWNGQPWTTITLPTPEQKSMYPKFPQVPSVAHCDYGVMPTAAYLQALHQSWFKPSIPSRFTDKPLSSFSAEDVGEMLRHLDGVRGSQAENYVRALIDNNVSGRVLLNCSLEELKALINMSFGDWELFRIAILALREREFHSRSAPSPTPLHQNMPGMPHNPGLHLLDVEYDTGRMSRSSSIRSTVYTAAGPTGEATTEVDSALVAKFNKRPNTIEKQVTLEDQAICGALQTLNEEALEDVLDEREAGLAASNMLDSLAINLQSYTSSNLSTCSDPAEMDVLYLQTSVVPDLPLPGLMQASSSLALGPRGFVGREDSVSITSSLASLAERGSVTPARQRTVTEVILPENVTAFSSGLRSRLGSSTSLVRTGSQKSVADLNYALGRRESQRSVSEAISKPQVVPCGKLIESSVVAALAASGVGGGWRSEQGSPRRPASLVLTESNSNRSDWITKTTVPTPDSLHGSNPNSQCSTPVALSPPTQNQRFTTTNVEISSEQVKATGKVAVRSPPKQRKRRAGVSQTRGAQGTSTVVSPPVNNSSKSRKGSFSSTESSDNDDGEREDAPLMTSKESGKRSTKIESRNLSTSTGNINKAAMPLSPESQPSLLLVNGSSTSSLDSPLDTTDNEVYKTVIPKSESSRRKNSLSVILNRPLDTEVQSVTQSKQDPGAETTV